MIDVLPTDWSPRNTSSISRSGIPKLKSLNCFSQLNPPRRQNQSRFAEQSDAQRALARRTSLYLFRDPDVIWRYGWLREPHSLHTASSPSSSSRMLLWLPRPRIILSVTITLHHCLITSCYCVFYCFATKNHPLLRMSPHEISMRMLLQLHFSIPDNFLGTFRKISRISAELSDRNPTPCIFCKSSYQNKPRRARLRGAQ